MIFVAVSVFLFGTIVSEHLQIIPKLRGAKSGKLARGYANAMKILLFNRGFSAFYFVGIAFVIESQALPTSIAKTFFCSFVFIFLFSVALRLRVREEKSKDLKLIALSCFATLSNYLGLSFPFLVAAIFPEFRLTLSYSGILFNSFYTVLNTLLIESSLAAAVDISFKNAIVVADSVFLGRIYAGLLSIVIWAAVIVFL